MIDLVRISITAGSGGNGCISFRREKFVPRGGPNGGDGGDGGHIFLLGDPSLNTLLHLKYHSTWRAKRGSHGSGNNKRGGNGEDVTIPVPIGTVVWNLVDGEDRKFVVDITTDSPVLAASGGRGGGGNQRFVSATHQEPLLAQIGEKGQSYNLILELKLLADVALIGQPNAGKSTLLSRCSAAKPKVAPYPFTTLDPVLGVVASKNRSFVIMEVPGLIEDAHKGAGLGLEFLRHAERARLLLHLLDGLSDDPIGDWRRINQELVSFQPDMASKPQFIVVNKADIPEVRERNLALEAELGALGLPFFFVSAATGEGVDALMGKTLEVVESLPKNDLTDAPQQQPTKEPDSQVPFTVTREKGALVVHAPTVERLVPMANLKDWRAMAQIWRELQRLGVVKVLEDQGVQPGDTVRLGNVELEWY